MCVVVEVFPKMSNLEHFKPHVLVGIVQQRNVREQPRNLPRVVPGWPAAWTSPQRSMDHTISDTVTSLSIRDAILVDAKLPRPISFVETCFMARPARIPYGANARETVIFQEISEAL